ncbi:hypothetical protein FB45DRAFT_1033852 [Roridomyces roridus]|uniref:Uncharacterized protein n=1 Tax=Roridomyces roridus TaxID=1738132 RepID=A0AAD7FHB2_9AGAR|nr:hypothetical protein FB45DRAFT_1033852 [Roridomyces roridus]
MHSVDHILQDSGISVVDFSGFLDGSDRQAVASAIVDSFKFCVSPQSWDLEGDVVTLPLLTSVPIAALSPHRQIIGEYLMLAGMQLRRLGLRISFG